LKTSYAYTYITPGIAKTWHKPEKLVTFDALW